MATRFVPDHVVSHLSKERQSELKSRARDLIKELKEIAEESGGSMGAAVVFPRTEEADDSDVTEVLCQTHGTVTDVHTVCHAQYTNLGRRLKEQGVITYHFTFHINPDTDNIAFIGDSTPRNIPLNIVSRQMSHATEYFEDIDNFVDEARRAEGLNA